MFFTKPTYQEMKLAFRLVNDLADTELGSINIEAYGNILGTKKYCYAMYTLKDSKMYQNGDYEQLLKLLKDTSDKTVKVIVKIKKDKLKSFKIDVNSLSEEYEDERFKFLSLVGQGLNDKSYKELSLN